MAMEFSLGYRLRWMDFDRFGRPQPWALLDLFQDTATAHAVELGIGGDDMGARGVFWAVVRTRYEMVGQLSHHQAVTVRTWPHSLSRFSFMRDYLLLDEEGAAVVRCSSEWVLMDAQTRKFVSAKDVYDGPTDFLEERAFAKKPRKIAPFDASGAPAHIVVPGFSDVDVNGHVNNAMYARFVMDSLDLKKDESVSAVQIDYRQEVHAGSPLEVRALRGDGCILAKGVREDGETSFTCKFELR